MLEILAKHAVSNFHFLLTGDELWLLYAYHVRTMWKLCPENVDETETLPSSTENNGDC
jgi:hypothetical protein